jgi:hypothetical protein
MLHNDDMGGYADVIPFTCIILAILGALFLGDAHHFLGDVQTTKGMCE